KKLWLSEGDLGKLLNDKRSIQDLRGFKLKQPQESLLNSQRMYRKLLEALDNMDTARGENTSEVDKKLSPLVRELDLFITTTDIANGYSPYKDKTSGGDWDKFFSDYLRNGLFDLDREARGQNATGRLPSDETSEQAKEQLRASFRDRSFGDGGYLDNKPFSYA